MFKKNHTSYILERTVHGKGVLYVLLHLFTQIHIFVQLSIFLFCKMILIWGLMWCNMQLCSLEPVKIISFRKHIMLEVVCRLDLCYVNCGLAVGSFGMNGHISVEIS